MTLTYKTTADIKIPKPLVEQIIGQEEAVEVVKKAAKQRRNVLLIGDPGIGKSLTAQALAELLPKENLTDILALPNPNDDNNPLIRELHRGEGKKLLEKAKIQSTASMKNQNIIFFILVVITVITPWWIRKEYGDIMAAASLIGSMIFLAAFVLFMNISKRMKTSAKVPKLLIDNSDKKRSPFVDATGAHAGSLLGDCLHDPLQSFSSLNSSYNISQVKNRESTNLLIKTLNLKTLLDPLFEKYKKEIIKNKNYESFFTAKDELKVLGLKELKVEDVEALSANRYNFKGNLIKITTSLGKEVIVTPEHKIAVKKFRKIIYKEAAKLTRLDRVVSLDL